MRRAMTLAPGSMSVGEGPEPVPGEGQAVVDVQVVGLCGSDYHLYQGTHPYSRFPQTQGHEVAGVVRSLPSGYRGAASIGDLVAIEPLLACGACFACQEGSYNCCSELKVLGAHVPGALAETIAVSGESLYPVHDLDAELTALVEPVSIGLQAVRRAGPVAGSTILVLGGGPIGLAATLAATDAGARVIVADRLPARLSSAVTAGASHVINSSTSDLRAEIRALTAEQGPAVVIDATGAPELIRTAIDVVAHSGTVVVVGISDREVSVPVIEFTRKEITIRGSRNNAHLFPQAISLVERHQQAVRSWITHRVALEDVPDVIEYAIVHPELVEKILVRVANT